MSPNIYTREERDIILISLYLELVVNELSRILTSWVRTHLKIKLIWDLVYELGLFNKRVELESLNLRTHFFLFNLFYPWIWFKNWSKVLEGHLHWFFWSFSLSANHIILSQVIPIRWTRKITSVLNTKTATYHKHYDFLLRISYGRRWFWCLVLVELDSKYKDISKDFEGRKVAIP